MKKVAATLKRHLDGVLRFVKYPITNGVAEGLNSKIMSIKRKASVDSSKPATDRHVKTGHHGRGGRDPMEFYFVASSVRKSVWTLVRQLRGPHLRTCA